MKEEHLLQDCKKIALSAGKLLLQHSKKPNKITEKKTYDLVTQADLAAEKLIISAIKKKYPNHAILSEEAGNNNLTSEYLWIIDPLDGTNNYAHKIPLYSTSIAVAYRNNVIAGAIHIPVFNEIFSASAHTQSMLNGKSIHVNTNTQIKKTILAVGFYYDRELIMRTTLKQIRAAFEHKIRGIRRMGSAAIDLCWTACGRYGGFWEGKLSPWDFAAGKLIVERAGGKVTTLENMPLLLKINSILASNPALHKKLYHLFSEVH